MKRSSRVLKPGSRIPEMAKSIPGQCLGLAAFFWLYHELLSFLMTAGSYKLGFVTADFHWVPLYADPALDHGFWVLPAVIILGLFLYLCRDLYLESEISTPTLLGISMLLFIFICLNTAMMAGNVEVEGRSLAAFLEPYTRTYLEYYGDVPRVNEIGVTAFLRQYTEPGFFTTLSGHTQTHPPGAVLFLWMVSQAFGYNLLSASLATVVFTSLAIIPAFWLGETLYGKKVARLSLAFLLVTPGLVMFTATSMDGPFAVFSILSICLFFRAVSTERWGVYAVLTGLSVACSMFMTYSTAFVGLFMGVFGVMTLIAGRDRSALVWRVLVTAAFTFAASYVLLYLVSGFNLLEALWASIQKDANSVGTGYETPGRYFNLSIANLFAFLIMVGIPLVVIWFRQIGQAFSDYRRGKPLDLFIAGYAISLLLISFSTLYTMETERIWIFMAPFIAIPAAKYISQRPGNGDFYWVVGLLCVQIFIAEATLNTHW